jgi:ankyrin repeat protein
LAIESELDGLGQERARARVCKEREVVAMAKGADWAQVEQATARDAQLCGASNQRQNTCLHFAVKQQKLTVIESLLKNNACPNAANVSGVSPLHVAALNGDVESSKLLVRYGADLQQTAGMPQEWAARYAGDESEAPPCVDSKVWSDVACLITCL